jgi:hypothetical protein
VALEARVDECVEKVWAKWDNGEKQGWCEHCGKPDTDGSMKNCGACKKRGSDIAAKNIRLLDGSCTSTLARRTRHEIAGEEARVERTSRPAYWLLPYGHNTEFFLVVEVLI